MNGLAKGRKGGIGLVGWGLVLAVELVILIFMVYDTVRIQRGIRLIGAEPPQLPKFQKECKTVFNGEVNAEQCIFRHLTIEDDKQRDIMVKLFKEFCFRNFGNYQDEELPAVNIETGKYDPLQYKTCCLGCNW